MSAWRQRAKNNSSQHMLNVSDPLNRAMKTLLFNNIDNYNDYVPTFDHRSPPAILTLTISQPLPQEPAAASSSSDPPPPEPEKTPTDPTKRLFAEMMDKGVLQWTPTSICVLAEHPLYKSIALEMFKQVFQETNRSSYCPSAHNERQLPHQNSLVFFVSSDDSSDESVLMLADYLVRDTNKKFHLTEDIEKRLNIIWPGYTGSHFLTVCNKPVKVYQDAKELVRDDYDVMEKCTLLMFNFERSLQKDHREGFQKTLAILRPNRVAISYEVYHGFTKEDCEETFVKMTRKNDEKKSSRFTKLHDIDSFRIDKEALHALPFISKHHLQTYIVAVPFKKRKVEDNIICVGRLWFSTIEDVFKLLEVKKDKLTPEKYPKQQEKAREVLRLHRKKSPLLAKDMHQYVEDYLKIVGDKVPVFDSDSSDFDNNEFTDDSTASESDNEDVVPEKNTAGEQNLEYLLSLVRHAEDLTWEDHTALHRQSMADIDAFIDGIPSAKPAPQQCPSEPAEDDLSAITKMPAFKAWSKLDVPAASSLSPDQETDEDQALAILERIWDITAMSASEETDCPIDKCPLHMLQHFWDIYNVYNHGDQSDLPRDTLKELIISYLTITKSDELGEFLSLYPTDAASSSNANLS